MAIGYLDDSKLTAIANSIRAKAGTSGTMTVDEMPTEIAAIPTGSEKDFFFYSYDGTERFSYTKDELDALTVLPTAPNVTVGPVTLNFTKWNWTLANLKLEDKMIVGALYEPSDHKNWYQVSFDAQTEIAYFSVPESGTYSISSTIDWGDGTTGTLTSSYTAHTYAAGTYWMSTEQAGWPCRDSSSLGYAPSYNGPVYYFLSSDSWSKNDSNMWKNFPFPGWLIAACLPEGKSNSNRSYNHPYVKCWIFPDEPSDGTLEFNNSSYGFNSAQRLSLVILPKKTSLTGHNYSNGLFNNCRLLEKVYLSKHGSTAGETIFSNCPSLKEFRCGTYSGTPGKVMIGDLISVPETIKTELLSGTLCPLIDGNNPYASTTDKRYGNLKSYDMAPGWTQTPAYFFVNSTGLKSVTIPEGITVLGSSSFEECRSLSNVTLPSTLTEIGSSCFSYCYKLTQLTIPAAVTSIGSYAFSGALNTLHMLGTVPPTIQSTTFSVSLPVITNAYPPFGIYVPYSADHSVLEAYKTATNWSTYANNIYEEPAP